MNPEDLSALLPALRVDEVLLLVTYRKLDAELRDDVRRFAQAVLNAQHARESRSNVVPFPRKT